MTEQTVSKISALATKTVDSARKNSWKFLGALCMEDKDGVQAVSLHRVLALSTYVACMWLWLCSGSGEVAADVRAALEAASVDVPGALRGAAIVPDAMLYTLWALLGINGASKVAGIFKSGGSDNA